MGPHTVLPTAARCSFCSGSRSYGMNFATTRYMPRSCVKISDTVGFGILRSASRSRTVSRPYLLTAACTCSTFSGVLLVAGLPECGSLSTDTVPHFYMCCTHCIIPERLLNHPNSFRRGMVKPNTKFDADLLPYLLSHFEWDSPRVHRLTQWCLPPPLTSTVKSSLFMHVHSSPLSLAARLR